MRSILIKLLLAFVVISLSGAGLFFGLARYNSNREIRDFLVNDDQQRIVDYLVEFYAENDSWEGVDQYWRELQFEDTGEPGRPGPVSPFILVDTEMRVVHGRGGGASNWTPGEKLSEEDLQDAVQISLEGEVIGWLLIAPPPDPAEFFKDQPIFNRINNLLIYSAVGSVLLALILGLLFSRQFSQPLKELSLAARKAAGGDLEQKVRVRTKDEIGILAESFNQMMIDLERMIAARKQMTADIAHELRTPISIILSHADGIHDGVLEMSPENIQIIRDEALHLERLVSDLRILSQADVGELPLEIQPVEIVSLLSEVKRTTAASLSEKEIALEIKKDLDLPVLVIDRDRILQVIRNILDNAIRHSPQNGKITIEVHPINEAHVQFSIQDSGQGIDPEHLPRIFDRFYQINNARTRDQGSSGLGLAIVKSIVGQHGGRIWAESPEGEGLKILFQLPIRVN